MQKEQREQRPRDDKQQKPLEKLQGASLAKELRTGTVHVVGERPALQDHAKSLEFTEGKA